MNVAIIGTGYVGLVTGVCLATKGHLVTCVDQQSSRVAMLQRGETPFFEPGLDTLLRETLASGTFSATADTAAAVADAELVIVTVGTPTTEGGIDLTHLGTALNEIGMALAADDSYRVVVIKSTVVPTTTTRFALPLLEHASGKVVGQGFGLTMNPEFLREGTAVNDFQVPDRIVIGEYDARSGAAVQALYEPYACPKVHTGLSDAELIKYTSNALLATLISFSNEVATVCEAVPGTDVETVMDALHLDRRLSPVVNGRRVTPAILTYLRAGAGFGGSCLPKDVSALRHFGGEHGLSMPLLDAVLTINAARPQQVVDIVHAELGDLRGRSIAILGLAFKAGTDDLRESASLRLAALLLAAGAEVSAYDPIALGYAHNSVDPRIRIANDAPAVFAGSDAVVLMTAWPQFKDWRWGDLTTSMRTAVVIDGRNALRKVEWPSAVRYRTIGTAKAQHAVAAVG